MFILELLFVIKCSTLKVHLLAFYRAFNHMPGPQFLSSHYVTHRTLIMLYQVVIFPSLNRNSDYITHDEQT